MGKCMSLYSLWNQVAITLKRDNYGFRPIGLLLKSSGPVFRICFFGRDEPENNYFDITGPIKFIFWKDKPESINMICNILPHTIHTSKIKNGYQSFFFETNNYACSLNISNNWITCRVKKSFINGVYFFSTCVNF